MSGSAQVNAILGAVQPNAPLSIGQTIQDVQGLQSTKNQILQNTDLNRTLQAKQAYAQALNQNINPDGSVNIQGLTDAAKTNPALAYALPTMLPQEQGQNLSAQDLKVKMLGNAVARAGLFSNVLSGALLAKGPDFTQDDAKSAAQAILNEDPGDPILQHDVTAGLAGMGNLQGAPLVSYVTNLIRTSQDSLAQLQTQLGGTQWQNTGSMLQQVAPTGYGSIAQTGQTIGETMTPSQATSTVTMVSPGPTAQFPNNPPAGTQIAVSQAQLATLEGQGWALPPQAQGGQQSQGGPPAPTDFNPANPASVAQAAATPGPQASNTSAGGGELGIQSGPTPTASSVAAANATTAGTTLASANNELIGGQKSLNLTKMAADLASSLQTRPGKSTMLNLAGNLQKYSGGLVSQKVVDALVGGADPNATPGQAADAQAAAQTLVKVVAGNIAQQYQANGGGQNLEFLNQIEQGNADVNKLPQLFKSLQQIQENNLNYDQQVNQFYTQHANTSSNLTGDFAKYAQTVHLTPDNAASWKDQNTVNGQDFNTLIQDSLSNPTKFPNAVALANKLQANPGVPVKISGGKMAIYDPTTGTYAIKAQ
jgi:hypothetical protein